MRDGIHDFKRTRKGKRFFGPGNRILNMIASGRREAHPQPHPMGGEKFSGFIDPLCGSINPDYFSL
jgi:hypothetical protein